MLRYCHKTKSEDAAGVEDEGDGADGHKNVSDEHKRLFVEFFGDEVAYDYGADEDGERDAEDCHEMSDVLGGERAGDYVAHEVDYVEHNPNHRERGSKLIPIFEFFGGVDDEERTAADEHTVYDAGDEQDTAKRDLFERRILVNRALLYRLLFFEKSGVDADYREQKHKSGKYKIQNLLRDVGKVDYDKTDRHADCHKHANFEHFLPVYRLEIEKDYAERRSNSQNIEDESRLIAANQNNGKRHRKHGACEAGDRLHYVGKQNDYEK